MILSWNTISEKVTKFSKKWKNASNEEAQSQSFLLDFMRCFNDEMDFTTGEFFENKVAQDDNKRGYIDFIWKGKIAIEMKSKGKDLDKAYEQLKEYIVHLNAEDIPPVLMVSDFENIRVYQRETGQSKHFKLKDLKKNIRQFAVIAGYETTKDYENREEVNIKATQKMAKLHDELKASGYEGHNLELYLVRLLFCLFAGDTGIFQQGDFASYIENSKEDGSDLSYRIMRLFEILNMPDEERKKRTNLPNELLKFRYINGGLFEELIPPADFNKDMRKLLLDARAFNWSEISPAIFGSMFQGVMNKEERRNLGAHYTNEENILKVINPLFMNDLWNEFERIKYDKASLEIFHDKICKLDFLDPACGCGNFLIITYRELRLLELEVLKMSVEESNMMMMTDDLNNLVRVNVDQFYGIEYEEFPCQIAKVGMWLMDHQMNNQVFENFGTPYYRLPLKSSSKIIQGNALRIDWNSVISNKICDYIIGNPPFIGGRQMSIQQKEDMKEVFGKRFKKLGNLDYVSAWYYKASEYIEKTHIQVGFVSTNSITQGEQVAILWKPLIEQMNISIDFAYQTFQWTNEAQGKAAVYCVIIGFSKNYNQPQKIIYDKDGIIIEATNINPYLVNAHNIFIESKTTPINDAPPIKYGSFALDDGNFTINEDEYDELIEKDINCKKYLRPFIGAKELINGGNRYCVWLKDISPQEIKSCKPIMEKINKVYEWRVQSKRISTKKMAEQPMIFAEIRQPNTNYLAIPTLSSERRRYIPIDFLQPNIIASNQLYIIENANMFHFGILTSNVHNAWMRAVSGRLEMRYRYSKDIVYNNFPWVETATEEQIQNITILANEILNVRNSYPDSSLADLYDPLTMPPLLLKAHKKLDKAVINLYGGQHWKSEADCVIDLMNRYKELVNRI